MPGRGRLLNDMNDSQLPSKTGPTSTDDVRAGVFRQTAWALMSKAVVAMCATFTALLIMRKLTTSEYGAFSLALSVLALWFILAEFGITISVSKWAAQHRLREPALARAFVVHGLALQTILAVAVAAGCYISSGYVARRLDVPELQTLLRIGSVLLLAQPLQMFALRVFEAFQRLKFLAVVEFVREIMRLATTVALVFAGLGAAGAIAGRTAGFAIAALLGVPIAWYFFVRGHRWRDADSTAVVRQVLHLSFPVLITVACQYIYTEFSITVVGYYVDTEQVGIYSIPARITIVLLMLAQAIALAIAPRLATAHESDRNTARWLLLAGLKAVLILYIPAILGLIALTPELLTVAVGEKALPACTVMRMYAVLLVFRAASVFFAPALIYLGRAKRRAAVMVVTSMANVGLHLVLVPRFGIVGAAASILITYIPTALIFATIACKTIDLPLSSVVRLALRVGACGTVMMAIVYVVGHGRDGLVGCLATIALGVLVYGIMVLATRTVTFAEVKDITRAGRI